MISNRNSRMIRWVSRLFDPTQPRNYRRNGAIRAQRQLPETLESRLMLTISNLVINEILADPPDGGTGDANGDGTTDAVMDEFVEIVNYGATPEDISGWTISDGASVRHTFPAATVIPAGHAVVVFGGGTPAGAFGGAAVQTASTGMLDLCNAGDTITLSDGSGNISVTYGSEGDNDQSLTRIPDVTGSLVQHTSLPSGLDYSPGFRNDGTSAFAGATGAFDIVLDYSFDSVGFFDPNTSNGAAARAGLEAAAGVFESFITDSLDAITPGPSGFGFDNSWTANFSHPGTGANQSITDLVVPEGQVIVFAGGRDLSGNTLGQGGPGGWSASGTSTFLNAVSARGEAGALANPQTDFGPWGGSITFDTPTNWNFSDGTPSGGQSDFFSVALHELGHALGFSTASSYNSLISAGVFTGPQATSVNGGTNPVVTGDGHWVEGTSSTIAGLTGTQEAAMDPSITTGTRKILTNLDIAGLDDLGWDVAVPAAVEVVVTHGGTGVTIEEGGSGGSLFLQLSDPVNDNVVVTLTPPSDVDLGSGFGTPHQVVFTAASGNFVNVVSVTAEDDLIIEGIQTGAITVTATSNDSRFTGPDVTSVTVTTVDNDGDAILFEPFDNSIQFTVSDPFFSIGDGSAFFGISDGAGGGDFGPDSPPTPTVPSYTGATGNFLTGMDMDASATGHATASLPITATWSDLNISGQTGLQFGADFASFDEGVGGDSGRHIEPSDFIRVEVQIDGGGFVNIMEFRGNNTGGTNAAYFSLDTDGDGSGDGTLLTDALRNFTADIVGSGNLLDLRISMSVSDQDEDFAIDNVTVTANNPTGPFVVDTNADESDGDYSAGDFSLREAIERANTHVGADDIQFAAGLSGQTITLTIDQLSVTDDLTITGLGASNLTVSGGNLFRIFDLQHTPDVVIDGLTLSGGRTNAVGQGGGAIRSSGNLQIIDSVITNSQTAADASDGGGIFQVGGTLTITDSTISNNSTTGANSFGGGISATQGAETIITGSTIDANTTASASGVGGGLLNIGGDVTITESTISNNENTGVGALGGGVVVAAGNLLVERSTISGNETTGGAGGIGFDSNGLTVIATIVNSTVSGNTTTSGFGGGIANFNGTMNIRHSTVTGNSATAGNGSGVASYTDGSALIANTVVLSSIIADNVNSDIDNILSGGGTNTITSSGFNLVGSGNAVSSFNAGSDLTGVSAGLGPLLSNGGPTQTHALLAGSAAIGAGDTTSAQATDQRGAGFNRLVGSNVDIGAFELQATNPSVTLSVDNANIPETAGVATFTATLSEISGETVTVDLGLSGTATGSGTDYDASGLQILIPAGSLTGFVTITAVQDVIDDDAETVIVDITGVTNGTENGIQQQTTIIVDDDDAAALTVSIVAASINENGGTTTGTVTRNTGTTGDLTVDLSSSDTTEASVPSIVTILDGNSSATFTITGEDDAIVDGTQTVTITASAAAYTDGTDPVDVTDNEHCWHCGHRVRTWHHRVRGRDD